MKLGLVSKTLDIISLARVLDDRRPVEYHKHQKSLAGLGLLASHDGVSDLRSLPRITATEYQRLMGDSRISDVARRQLFTRIAKIIEALEDEVLREIDGFVKKKPYEKLVDPLIPALCIRRLALYYRRIMKHYKAFGKREWPIGVKLFRTVYELTAQCLKEPSIGINPPKPCTSF